ncbi:Asialoglycoprotein receptor 1 [Mactra antiquata]
MLVFTLAFLYVHLVFHVYGCPDGFITHGTQCYHFSHDKEAYMIAQLVCEQMGATLAKIDTQAEGNFLSAQIHNVQTNGHHWIGLNDILEEGTWRWHTTGALLTSDVANWDTHEPNTSNPGLENCVVIKTDGKWGDDLCMASYPYICEMTDGETGIIG